MDLIIRYLTDLKHSRVAFLSKGTTMIKEQRTYLVPERPSASMMMSLGFLSILFDVKRSRNKGTKLPTMSTTWSNFGIDIVSKLDPTLSPSTAEMYAHDFITHHLQPQAVLDQRDLEAPLKELVPYIYLRSTHPTMDEFVEIMERYVTSSVKLLTSRYALQKTIQPERVMAVMNPGAHTERRYEVHAPLFEFAKSMYPDSPVELRPYVPGTQTRVPCRPKVDSAPVFTLMVGELS